MDFIIFSHLKKSFLQWHTSSTEHKRDFNFTHVETCHKGKKKNSEVSDNPNNNT